MGFTFIVDLVPGETIQGKKRIRENEDIFEVHFPGFPVIPGTFLTEMMAQTAGRCLDAENKDRGRAMLARIKSAHFRKYVGPSQTAVIHGKILVNREQYAVAQCRIDIDEATVCTAELMFTFVRLEKFAPDFQDEVLRAYSLSKRKTKESGGHHG
jgi:3-hydroxyacyl-[acyl-carrier-protein] dehydratase